MHQFSILPGISTGIESAQHLQDSGCVSQSPYGAQALTFWLLLPPAFSTAPQCSRECSVTNLSSSVTTASISWFQVEGGTGTKLTVMNLKMFWVKVIYITVCYCKCFLRISMLK